jgi:hypothetical protein
MVLLLWLRNCQKGVGARRILFFIAVVYFLFCAEATERNTMNDGDVMLGASPLSAYGCIPSGLYKTNTLEIISSKI